jgi:type I restriction enzyme M protein
VILPFVVLRRLECALEKNKDAVIERNKKLKGIKDPEAILNSISGHNFYNVSPLNLSKILSDPNKVTSNLNNYIYAFSPSASEVLDKYGFPEKIKKLESADLLYQIVAKFADLDLSEESVSNEAMGYIFEELLRRFSEMSNETAGEHYTPREVIRLMVNLLFIEDSKSLTGEKPIRSIYDPACGTGGMLSIAEEHLHEMNPNIVLNVFGQELNDETWAIARSDLMIKGQDPKRITQGNSLTDEDGHTGTLFDYCISNPPYGVDWKKYEKKVRDEAENMGFRGRYGAGLPRVSDGSFLFIQHMISKMKPYDSKTKEGGSRIAVILSGSPLFSGQPGSGESEIRRWIIENDWLEGIVAMPDQMFYNTGIGTFIWIISNKKSEKSKGLVRLIDARNFGHKMKKNLGAKRKDFDLETISLITELYANAFVENNHENIRVLKNEDFGFARLTVEQPLRLKWAITEATIDKVSSNLKVTLKQLIGSIFTSLSEAESAISALGVKGKEHTSVIKAITITDPEGKAITGKKSQFEADTDLRENENIDLPTGYIELSDEKRADAVQVKANAHLISEIQPYISDAWIDHSKTKIGYEIPFTRHFFKYEKPRLSSEIASEVEAIEIQIKELMKDLS